MSPAAFRHVLHVLLKVLLGVGVLVFVLLLGRAFQARSQPALKPWHTLQLHGEVSAEQIGPRYTWAQYEQAEARLFEELNTTLAAHPTPGPYRFEAQSQLGARPGQRDWNRSYVSTPAQVRGGVLLLHGLSDSPYSLRHLAARYERAGFVVIAPRLPGHGTLPSGLLDVRWQDWSVVVDLAARELRQRIGGDKPLHVVGYSNGAALALQYALDAAARDDAARPRVDRLVLLSPMIGVSRGAALAGLLPVFGKLPYFAQSRWLDNLPEFNPYKYNSFPFNAAAQSYELTTHVQAQVLQLKAAGRLQRLPPILAFQSVLDNTVNTDAVVHALFDHLPANGSELVLFDINRANLLAPLLTPAATGAADTLRGDGPRAYTLTLVSNLRPDTLDVGASTTAPGQHQAVTHPLGLQFPSSVYSLSHVALPFPMDDALYGLTPRMDEDFGIRLGTATLHGERGALVVKAEQLQRLNCNPFYPYLIARIAQTLPQEHAAVTATTAR
ncbi:Esterase/lipase [Pseudoxanthomonas sp. GM95]|uniref:alpha/beta hydrolase n=1 Tax=Pseudoxanthomonas sp. GM95 TaxID=1881043 RepID=UPI0008ADAF4D|nr:alpha/beta fold hydrolase [Pseudoxanthomonas sp. GM95]SEM10121.1 Esterase/lipase [Pseudoxanthomonas sp. GM95]